MKIGKVTGAALASGALVAGTAGVAVIGAVGSDVLAAQPAGACGNDVADFHDLVNAAPPHDTTGVIYLYTDHCGNRKGLVDISPAIASAGEVSGEAFLYNASNQQIGHCFVPAGTSTCSTGWINHNPSYAKGHMHIDAPFGSFDYVGSTHTL